ncbi:MAG TPA: hypothetical protein VIM25_12165 [Candidatus Limnocylindrales bacterium]|jgi:hypothetical protein
MSHTDACVLCGNDVGTAVRMQLVEWREPIGKETWSYIPRCSEPKACRDRVENVLGEPWPLDGDTPATAKPSAPDASSVVTQSEPEEVIPWLR